MGNFKALVVILSLIIFESSCKKDSFITDSGATLTFSTDTLYFDTVFTQMGSATRFLKVYNPHNKKIRISELKLNGGTNSFFKLNIDGISSVKAENIDLLPKDSLWLFLQVLIDPRNSNTPLIVEDELSFTTNGQTQKIKLVAWGQDGIYLKADTRIPGLPPFSVVPCTSGNTAIWKKDKPIVIFDYAVVDSGCNLIVEAGARIHFYNKNSGLWIYKHASIKVNGTPEEPVSFQGSRLEYSYSENVAGQWDRIWINESAYPSEFNNTIIKNGYIGIQAEVLQEGFWENKLILNNVFIRNMSGWGLLTRFFNVDAQNTQIFNCQNNMLALTFGGNYNFTHCTFANYWSDGNRKNPILLMNNHTSSQTLPFNARFINCILYGNKENELESDFITGADSLYYFENCLIKSDEKKVITTNNDNFKNCIRNQDPAFKNRSWFDLHLTSESPCINVGSENGFNKVPLDADAIQRSNPPSIGAFEFK